MFEQLESRILESFLISIEPLVLESFVIRTPSGKREKSLKQHKARLDAKKEKVESKNRSRPSKWIVNEHGTPKTADGVRQFATDCSPTRREAVEKLAAAYDRLKDSKVSPFGEYVEKEGFFESESEVFALPGRPAQRQSPGKLVRQCRSFVLACRPISATKAPGEN